MIKFEQKYAYRLILSFLIGFLLLTGFIIVFPSSRLDLKLSKEIQEHHNAFIDVSMEAISWFGMVWVSIISVSAVAILLYLKNFKRESVFCLLVLLIGVINYLIKIGINRPRPGKELVRVIITAKHQSFPSGHTSFYVVFFGLLIFLMHHKRWFSKGTRKWLITFCLFQIFTIPLSRVYLGAHWFTDVTGGFLIGSVYLLILLSLYLDSSFMRKLKE